MFDHKVGCVNDVLLISTGLDEEDALNFCLDGIWMLHRMLQNEFQREMATSENIL